MSDSSNSGSEDGSGKGNEWEVVSLSLSSHPLLSASSNRQRNGGGGGGEGEAFASALNSEYFFCSPDSPSESGRLSLNNAEEWPSIAAPDNSDGGEKKKTNNNNNNNRTEAAVSEEVPPAGHNKEEALSAADDDERGEDHGKDAAALSPVARRSCASQMQEFSGMDWLEPVVPVDYEQDEIGSASILYGLAPESKAGAEPDFLQAGPLLGSCLSSPSSPTIVSRVNSMQWVLGEEVFQGHVDGCDESNAPSCLVEDEMPSLAGLERESFGENSGLEFPDSGTGMGRRKTVAENTKRSAPSLGDGCDDDQTCEVWWKQWAALWCMQARQANTLWSIALAATVMGLVIIGHRWQHEHFQNQQLRLQLCSKDEKISQLVFQIARLKEALSGRRRVPVLRTSSSYSSFLDRV